MLTRKTLLASSLAMILTACGGPNNPTGPEPLPPVSEFTTFSIAGQIVGPVNITNLMLYYGDTALGVPVDANGHYLADINVLTSDNNHVVYAVATDSQNDKVKLVSIVGVVDALDIAAGADDMLTFDEAHSVNVSRLSTALAALMETANDGQVVLDKAMFDNAQKNYDSALLRAYANVVGMVADNAGAVDYLNLPEGFADTWALVNDPQAAQDYLNTVRQHDSQLYWTVDNALLANAQMVSSTPAISSLAGSYYFTSENQLLGEGRMILDEDGTGQWTSSHLDVPFNWFMGDNGLAMNFKSGGEVISTRVYGDGRIEELRWTHSNMKWLNDSPVAAQLVSTNHYETVRLDDENQNYSKVTKKDLKAVKESGVVAADNLFERGKTYVISLPLGSFFSTLPINNAIHEQTAELVLSGGLATLNVAGIDEQGLRIDESLEISWGVDDKGHLTLGHDTTQGVFDLAVLSENGGTTPLVNVQFSKEMNDSLRHFTHTDNILLKDEDVSWDTALLAGIYRVSSLGNNTFDSKWLELNEDGTILWVQTYDNNANGVIEFEKGELWAVEGHWQLGDEGDLIVRRYGEKVSDSTYYGCTSDAFEPATDSACQLIQQSNWSLYQQKEASFYLNEMVRFYKHEDNHPQFIFAQMKNQRLDKILQRPVDISAALELIEPKALMF